MTSWDVHKCLEDHMRPADRRLESSGLFGVLVFHGIVNQ